LGEGNLDISFISPGSTPGVLGDDIVDTIFRSIANSKDTMVDLVTTSSCDDTIFVVSEDVLVTLNTDRDWSEVDSSLKLRFTSLDNLVHGLYLTNSLRLFIVTEAVSGFVRVVRVELKRLVFNIDESFPWCTTTTSCVLVRARDKLLDRVNLKWTTILKEHSSFNSSSC